MMTNKLSFNNIEELTQSVYKKAENTFLYREIVDESAKYPCGILIRNGNRSQALSRKKYKSFMSLSKDILTSKYFPCLYNADSSLNYRPHGGGFMIPIEKSQNVDSIIHSLKKCAENNKLDLRIEKSKDGPCEDGRNTITEWKLLPPDITVENAAKFFSDFGTVKSIDRQDEGLSVTFSQLEDTLLLCYLLNSKIYGSSWFSVFKNRSVVCRFTSSLSCSKCQLKGHHLSRCPKGLAEIVRQYNSLCSNSDSSPTKTKQKRNQKDTNVSVDTSSVDDKLINQIDSVAVDSVNNDTVSFSRKTKSKRTWGSNIDTPSTKKQVTLRANTSKSGGKRNKNSKDPSSAKNTSLFDSSSGKKQNATLTNFISLIKDPNLQLFSDNFDKQYIMDTQEN